MAVSRLIRIAACLAATLSAQQTASPTHLKPTYERIFGGSNSDMPTSITTDLQANVIVAGTTDSVDFPTTPGSYKPTPPPRSEPGKATLKPFSPYSSTLFKK